MPSGTNFNNNLYQAGVQSDMMFYDRQQNFGFPITTTNAEGAMVTSTLGTAKVSGIDGLSRLNAEIKTGHVQLEDNAFSGEYQQNNMDANGQDDEYQHDA